MTVVLDQRIRAYFREKRIQRILSFYSRLQPAKRLTGKRASMVSRDSVLQLIVTFICLMVCAIPFAALMRSIKAPAAVGLCVGAVSAFLAVELADWVLLKVRRAVDLTFDFILPLLAAVLIAVTVVGVKYFNWSTVVPQRFENWRTEVNERLQKRPLAVRLRQTSGVDWLFATNEAGQLTQLTFAEAEAFCSNQGAGWGLYTGSAQAEISADRPFYIWMAPGIRAAQVDPGPMKGPQAFVSSSAQDRHATLCVRSGGVR